MRDTSGRPEQLAHHTQTFSTSCQSACVAIALARRGEESVAAIEARLHSTAGPRGHDVTDRSWSAEPRTAPLKSTLDDAALTELRNALARGAWVMVHVFGPACFFALDPFYSRDQQPFEVSDAELLQVWTGFPSLVIEL